MANYVTAIEGYDTEDLAEDEELIEAVEAIVGVAAVSVTHQIVHEIRSVWDPVQAWLEFVFPILVVYQENPSLIWQDLEHWCVYLVVFAMAFCVLAPRQNRGCFGSNKKGPPESGGCTSKQLLLNQQRQQQQHRRRRSFAGKSNYLDNSSGEDGDAADELLYRGGSLNTLTARYLLMEEETDEERFARVYPSLSSESKYANLILPPSCQLIEKPKAMELRNQQQQEKQKAAAVAAAKQQQQQQQEKKHKKKRASKRRRKQEKSTLDEADDPMERLRTYFRHFMVLVRSLFTYDWAGAMWTILLWMQGIIKHRRINSRTNMASSADQDNEIDMAASTDGDSSLRNLDSLLSSSRRNNNNNYYDDGDSHDGGDTIDTTLDNNNDNVSLKNHHTVIVDDEKDENQTSLTVPVSPFATPLSDTGLVTLQVGPQTPRVPLLESSRNQHHQQQQMLLSPLVEEKKEPNTPYQDASESSSSSSRPNLHLKQRMPPSKLFLQLQPQRDENEEALLPEKSEWEDLPSFGSTPSSVEFVSATSMQPLTTRSAGETTIVTNNLRKTTKSRDYNDDEEDDEEGESDTLPETPRSQLSIDEYNNNSAETTTTTTTTDAKLKSSTWYFFETAHSKESLKRMSLAVPVPDKNGYVLGDEYLPDDRCTPLLVFVNSRSGPRQGHFLITQLRRLLNPIQIWDLADGGPETILESFCTLSKLRILVCGGDGTVSWIISALDSLKLKRKWPPIAILPLGTGNDLARVHGWGAGYNNESIITILEQISESYISVLDRWELTVEQGSKKKRVTTKNFLNYFSVGVDAEAALQVHNLREHRPDWFFSRLFNKAWYAFFGAEQHIKGNGVNVQREITLYADGVLVPLPASSQGIIIMNIDSYAGGIPLWSYGVKAKECKRYPAIRRSRSLGGIGVLKSPQPLPLTSLNSMGSRIDSSEELADIPLTEEEMYDKITACDAPASCQDGYLEIVSIRGLAHLGQCTLGVGNAERVGQCRELKIVIKKKVPVQIDGEPWRQDRCVLRIRRKQEPALMLHRSADDGGIETEMSKLLEWAEERNLIDSQVHSVLMKEFSRRIESKTRQRRVRTLERGVVQHLKRAMGSTGAMANMGNNNAGYINGSLSNDEEDIRRSRSMHNMAAIRQMNSSGPIAF